MTSLAARLRQILKNYIVPPALIELLKRRKNRVGFDESGRPTEALTHNILEEHSFAGLKADRLGPAQANGETRFAATLFSGDRFSLAVTPKNPTFFYTGIRSKSSNQPPRDFELYLNGSPIACLRGNIPSTFWTNLKIPIKNQERIDLKISYEGKGSIALSRPILEANTAKKRRIILIVADSLMHDDVGLFSRTGSEIYGEGRATPEIDRFFDRSLLCTRAFSQGEWTLPVAASMMTGVYPIQHGLYSPRAPFRTLPIHIKTLPEMLRENGYTTLGITTGARFSSAYGHNRGFDRFICKPRLPATSAVDEMIQFLNTHEESNVFGLIHLLEPHAPYGIPNYESSANLSLERWADPSAGTTHAKQYGETEQLMKTRASMISEMDHALGKLFKILNDPKLNANTSVIITADHGHELNIGRPILKASATHVPLMLKVPEQKARKILKSNIEASIDIYPTILELAEIPCPKHIEGHSILSRTERHITKPIISESPFNTIYEIAIRDEKWTWISRYEFDPMRGTVNRDKKITEYLYKTSNETEPSSIAQDRATKSPLICEKFTKIVEMHLNSKEKFYDENCHF